MSELKNAQLILIIEGYITLKTYNLMGNAVQTYH
jgi:hypothetical protein